MITKAALLEDLDRGGGVVVVAAEELFIIN